MLCTYGISLFLVSAGAVYTINLDDVRSVAPGCCKEMLGTVQNLDIDVRIISFLC